MVLSRFKILITLILILLILAACSAENNLRVDIPSRRDAPLPTVLAVPEPKNVLSICLGDEPSSLFLYGDQSRSARIIRQAIYDWTANDSLNEIQSAAIAEIPSLENQLVTRSEVEVFDGDRIVDAHGNLTVLTRGSEYRPAGCSDSDCWEIFDQSGSVFMDQVLVEFPMRPDLYWSDGTPVTPEDSVLSYQAAGLIYGGRGPAKLQYNSSYRAEEDGSLVWVGIPGYLGILSYPDLFFDPLPSHLLTGFTREDLLTSESNNLQPLSWGAYRIVEWVPGDHITLDRNEYYFNGDGNSSFDALVFRFMNDPEQALAAFYSGECQLIADQPGLPEYQLDILQAERDQELEIHLGEALAWEQISFGIDPINQNIKLLESPQIRQALAGCVDREKLSSRRLESGGVVNDFFQSELVGQDLEIDLPEYQPIAAGQILRDLGWIDDDGDPDTPRLAENVEGIPDGASLELILLTGDNQNSISAGALIAEGIRSCGVGIEVQSLPEAEFLAPGPEGPVFGRQFDLAYFAWAAGSYQPCRLYITDEIPGIYPAFPKGWGGVNATGFSSEEFDQACGLALASLPDLEGHLTALEDIRSIYREQLPSLPLLFRREIIISSPQISGISDVILPSLWNIERITEIDSGE